MSKIIKISLFVFVAFWFYACKNECTNCEEYTRNLALYVKVQGTAKDSILNIEGNIYNEITGTRTIFTTIRQDSVYFANIQVFEDLTRCGCELDVFLKGDKKRVLIDLTGKLDFSESRVQVMTIEITFGFLGMEVHFGDYVPKQEIEDDLEIKTE